MDPIKPNSQIQQSTLSEEDPKPKTKQQKREQAQIEKRDIDSRSVSVVGVECQQFLSWAEAINEKHGERFYSKTTSNENRIRKAYIIYDEDFNKKSRSPDRFRQYELFDKLKEIASNREPSVSTNLKRKGKYYSPDESEKLNLDILQGPWFISPKSGFSEPEQLFQARLSITVNDEGYIPLFELLTELSDSKHPLNSIIRGCKIYGPELIGCSADTAIIYLNPSELSTEKMKAITALFRERIDKFSAPDIPCGMQQLSSCVGYAETPKGATSSYGMHRAEVIVFALEKYHKNMFPSLSQALEHAYEHYGLKVDNPALCAKAT